LNAVLALAGKPFFQLWARRPHVTGERDGVEAAFIATATCSPNTSMPSMRRPKRAMMAPLPVSCKIGAARARRIWSA